MELPDALTSFLTVQELKVEDDEIASLSCHNVGELVITSGKLIACDPYYCADTNPFATALAPGLYQIIVCIGHLRNGDQRVAFALLQVNDTIPVNWAIALPINHDLSKGKSYYYCVDSAIGCFMDADAVHSFAPMCEDYDPDTDPILEAMHKNYIHSASWANVCVDQDTGVNIIAFHSGWGDGGYPSYFGYDENERITCLITDFGVLEQAK